MTRDEEKGEGAAATGISHWNCPKCRRSFAWMLSGRSLGAPKCPHCKHVVSPKEVARTEEAINKFRDDLEAKDEAEWAARTPEQEAATEAGRAGYRQYVEDGKPPLKGTRIRSGPLAMTERCPYKYIPKAVEQHPLRAWWCRGWNHEEWRDVSGARSEARP